MGDCPPDKGRDKNRGLDQRGHRGVEILARDA